MKKRKNLIIIILVILMCLILGFVFINFIDIKKNEDNNDLMEYTPEEEISDKQMRNTIVSLYFLDTSSNSLKSEGRLIDSIELLNDPYKTLIKLLIDGPKTDTFSSVIPKGTQILDTNFEESNVTLNFSPEILDYTDEKQKYNIINTILNTLSELTEVDSFTIVINGQINEKFPDTYSVIH